MSTRIRDIDYDGPTFEKLAHHMLPRSPGVHVPVVGMVEGKRLPRERRPRESPRLAAERADREQAKRERQARMAMLMVPDLMAHFGRRRAA